MLNSQLTKPSDGAAFAERPPKPDRVAKATTTSRTNSAPPTSTSRALRFGAGGGCIGLR